VIPLGLNAILWIALIPKACSYAELRTAWIGTAGVVATAARARRLEPSKADRR
jgi:hypothetical protein